MKWTFTIQLLGSTLLHFAWSSEPPADKKRDDKKETPGPITDRTTAPSTSFGLQRTSTEQAHKRAAIN